MRNNVAQLGRSMIEMLSVIAIMGVLSIVSIKGYQYAMVKQRENDLLQFVHIGYVELVQNDDTTEWLELKTKYNTIPLQGYLYNEKAFIKASNVDEALCTHLINQDYELFTILTPENLPLTNCDEINVLVFDLDNIGTMEFACEVNDTCYDNQYCTWGECKTCEDGYELDDIRTSCILICPTETDVLCAYEGQDWCCAQDTVCGSTLDSCVEKQDFCSYTVNTSTEERASNCSYMVYATNEVRASNCSYTIAGTGETTTVTKAVGCDTDEYCAIAYSSSDCVEASSSYTGTIYGTCYPVDKSNLGCPIVSELAQSVVVQQGCGSDQYCAIAYTNTDCSTSASSNHTGVIYGSCYSVANTNLGCPIIVQSERIVSGDEICPLGQYCTVLWSDQECTDASSGATGKLYGVCNDITDSLYVCPVEVEE